MQLTTISVNKSVTKMSNTWVVHINGDVSEEISIQILKDETVYIATSIDLPGLIATSKDLQELEDLIVPQAIMDIYRSTGKIVTLEKKDE